MKKRWDMMVSEDSNASLDLSIEKRIAGELKKNLEQFKERRRNFLWAPASAVVGIAGIAAVTFRVLNQNENGHFGELDEDLMAVSEQRQDFELVAEIDFLEDLEEIEEWNENEV